MKMRTNSKIPPSQLAIDNESFASGSDIDAQYLDILNSANELASQGDIKLGIRMLSDEIDERLDRYGSKDKGIWVYSKGIAYI
jgi:CRISPR/Cas system-associated endonuclease Cas3-HD